MKHHVPVIYYSTGLEHEYHKPVDDANLINYSGEAAIIEYIERLIRNVEKIENLIKKIHEDDKQGES